MLLSYQKFATVSHTLTECLFFGLDHRKDEQRNRLGSPTKHRHSSTHENHAQYDIGQLTCSQHVQERIDSSVTNIPIDIKYDGRSFESTLYSILYVYVPK